MIQIGENMKILFLVPYVHSDTLETYKRFSVGLSFTLESIIKKMALDGYDVYVYTQATFSPGYEENSVHYLPKKPLGALPVSGYYLKAFRVDTKDEKFSLKRKLHILSYYMYGNDVERILKSIKPDIVSIRGIGYITRPFILACKNIGVKYVVSLHGAVSLSDTAKATKNEQAMERKLFRDAADGKEKITVIASGIKRRVLESIGLNADGEAYNKNIWVINNGVDLQQISYGDSDLADLRRKYNIQNSDTVFISAGTICERKNQLQILRAFHLLPKEIKDHSKLLFLGKGELLDDLKQLIINLGEFDRAFACGYIPISDVQKYFAISNINVIASIDEGFGRAFVEGFLLGIPAITYSDLDAVEDLYDPCAMIRVDNRSDRDLCQGFVKAYEQKWNSKDIKKHAERYSVKNMVINYENLYEELISQ